ncbi:MAG: LacI family DNA-binding transcriptional regulator [Bacteroidota bacterium]|nr:LacI family DNA-binding transcriptional regulator [Bacteroidota bacterium]
MKAFTMRITIKQVAEKSGVSIATVSRVFNNSNLVDVETRDRVILVAEELRYSPNQLARSLSKNRTDTVGLLLPDLYGEFFSEIIRGVDQIAQQFDNHLLVSSAHNKREEIRGALRVMSGRVDGLIVMSPNIDAETLHLNLPKNLPVVLLNCYINDKSFDSINIDNFAGANLIVKHLIEHGHKKIAMIKGNDTNYDAAQRIEGYRAALMEFGLDYSSYAVLGDFTQHSGYEAAKNILAMKDRPTAIFASNDSMAIGALSALKEFGVEVPREMAIVGFDDIPVTQYLQPPLTTVCVDVSEYGALAIKKLYAAIQESSQHIRQHVVISPRLSIRDSCGFH